MCECMCPSLHTTSTTRIKTDDKDSTNSPMVIKYDLEHIYMYIVDI